MNRYIVFCGECYYPMAGAGGLFGVYEDKEGALDVAKNLIEKKVSRIDVSDGGEYSSKPEWSQVYDIEKREIIGAFGDEPYGCWSFIMTGESSNAN